MLHVRTPLIRSTPLSDRLGSDVWLKLEACQPAGSFKQRGMGCVAERAVDAGARRLVTSSGGNAGLAVAVVGRALGVPVLVVVPTRTSPAMRARIAAEGADVRVHGDVWDDAHAHAQTLVGDDGVLIHPFDHPDVWTGNATLVHELAEAMPRPGGIVLSVGGGGLLLGVLQGLREVGWASVPVLAVETEGAASFAAAMAAGGPVTLPAITSIALTLGSKRVADEAYRRGVEHGVQAITVSDREAVEAIERFLDEHRILVEPACGAALAGLERGRALLDGPIVVVVCGGASATREALAGWQAAVRDPT